MRLLRHSLSRFAKKKPREKGAGEAEGFDYDYAHKNEYENRGELMKVEYINPFVEGVSNLFTTMLDCDAVRGDVNILQENDPPTQSIVAIIGLSGSVRGCVTMVFPARTAMHLAHKLLGTSINELDQNVMDAMAEMVNVVAGAAKAKLNDDENSPAQLSLPTVILGRDYRIQHPSWSVWLDIPFNSPLGPFNLCVSVETNHSRKGAV